MADKNCANFINNLTANLEESLSVKIPNGELVSEKFEGTLTENFDRIRKDYGFWVNPSLNGNYAAVTNLRGITFSEKDYSLDSDLTIKHAWPGGFGLKSINISRQLSTTLTLVHELIHAYYRPPATQKGALMAYHPAMARAARTALVQAGIVDEAIPIRGSESYYFDDALALACGKVNL